MNSRNNDIAIVGMAGRFPEADNLSQFWDNLCNGRESVRMLTDDELKKSRIPVSQIKDDSYVKVASVINDIDKFDPVFFKIPPIEAELMDPQIRLLLQCAWETLEDAGHATKKPQNIGVFAGMGGISTNYYSNYINVNRHFEKTTASTTHLSNDKDYLSTYISYKLNLIGPSMTIQCACSTSLVTVHQACLSLLNNECDMALAGGVNLRIPDTKGYQYKKGHIFSKSGHISSFDENADGVVFGNGLGLVLIKKLEDAIRDNNHIYAVIKGTSILNDGKDKFSYAATSLNGQQLNIENAIKKAGIDADTIGYIESHGTGTFMGDPIEVGALNNALSKVSKKAAKSNYCALGAVKANIGHLDSASGIAGLIKAVLSVHNKVIPPTINYNKPNPRISFDKSPFFVNTELIQWEKTDAPRRAGVNSVGIGGTNAFILLEEFVNEKTNVETSENNTITSVIVPISAKTKASLNRNLQNLAGHITANSGTKKEYNLTNVSYTLQIGRDAMECRTAFVVSSLDELHKSISQYLDNNSDLSETERDKSELLAENKNIQDEINECIERGDWKKIALLWESGFDFNWNSLYANQKPQLISLPLYSFEKDRYWVDEDATVSINGKASTIHPLLHINTSDLNQQSYSSTFTGEEFFLKDHQLNGQKVLPGVAYLEMARAAIDNGLPDKPTSSVLELNNVIWLQPIAVHESRNVSIALFESEGGIIEFEIYSVENDKDIIHCQGNARYGNLFVPEKINLTNLENRMSAVKYEAAHIYSWFNTMGLGYGESHKGINSIHLGDKELIAHVSLPVEVENGLKEYVLHPSIMDSAFQTSAGLLEDMGQEPGLPPLPFALDSIRMFSALKGNMFVWTRYSKGGNPEDKIIKLDIDICDQEGNTCVQMRGFASRMQNNKEENSTGKIVAVPVWEQEDLTQKVKIEAEQHCIVYGLSEVQHEELKSHAPNSQILIIPETEGDSAAKYEKFVLTCFNKIQSIIKNKPQGNVLLHIAISNNQEGKLYTGVAGLLKTASMETPLFNGQVILTDPQVKTNELSRQLNENYSQPQNTIVKYEEGQRFVQRWQEIESDTESNSLVFKENGVYLITGGLGSLGTLFTKEVLNKTQKAKVILTGRSALNKAIQRQLENLYPNSDRIVYKQLDLTNQQEVKALVSDVIDTNKVLSGVIHCAGMVSDNFILKKTTDEVSKVLMPKVTATYNLDLATKYVDLDFMILFSSVASAVGNLGQSDYAAANGFLDQFAEYRNNLVAVNERQGKTLAINWPLWQDGGMGIEQSSRDLLKQTLGMHPMQTQTGLKTFYDSLKSRYSQTLVMEGEIRQMRNVLFSQTYSPLVPVISVDKKNNNQAIDIDGLKEKTEDYLRKQFSSLLKLPAHKIEVKAALEKYGIDSILAINLTNKLEKTFGSLSKTLFFEYQSIRELAGYFLKSHAGKLSNLFSSTVKESLAKQAESVTETTTGPNDQNIGSFRNRKSRQVHGMHSSEMPMSAREQSEPIAIVGLSGRYPKSDNIEEFWYNLREGKDCISEVPKDRWDLSEYYSEDRNKEGYHFSKWGGFISGVDEFDPLFFNISPREAENIDPQERLFLQYAWMAVEDAGYTRQTMQTPQGNYLPGQVGVYVGVMWNEYQLFGAEASLLGTRKGIAGNPASIANRVSYVLNLHGPSMTIDTMCSSSLSAIHIACQDLKQGRTNMAIAGGVNVTIHPNKYLMLSAGQFISSNGHCQSFGEGGDGYIPGEGVGAVILKRLSDAQKDGNHIYGVIKGSALNHGGKTNGYSVPNPQAQFESISRALKEFNVDARHVSYIEAHGTGTKLGDPIEIAALTKIFNEYTNDKRFCLIGSAKSNIGHCESAAGIAGITKVLLQMKYQQIVPSLHSAKLNPHIDFDNTPFKVNQVLRSWEQLVINDTKIPRIAGISSFGAGGSNSHLVIEEYSVAEQTESTQLDPIGTEQVIIPLSARTQQQLKQKAMDLLHFIQVSQEPERALPVLNKLNLSAIAYTLQVGREALAERLGFLVSSIDELAEKLEAFTKGDQDIEDLYQGQVKNTKESMSLIGEDEDMLEALDKWISRKKLSKLLDLWVKGLELDWNKLYENGKPAFVSLPTYPFAKDKYWMEIPQKQAIVNTGGKGAIHPMLHENTSDLLQQSYSSVFSGMEAFFENGQPNTKERVLTKVSYLEMARAAAEKSMPWKEDTDILELHDVMFGEAFVVPEKDKLSLVLSAKNKTQANFEIYSNGKAEEVVHCQGKVAFGNQQSIEKINIEQLKSKMWGNGLPQTIEEIKSIFVGDNELLAHLTLSAKVEEVGQEYLLHPQLLNSALHASTNLISKDRTEYSIPFAISSIKILTACTKEMFAWVRYADGSQPEDSIVKLNVDLCDVHGNICVQLVGIQFHLVTLSDNTPQINEIEAKEHIQPTVEGGKVAVSNNIVEHEVKTYPRRIEIPATIVKEASSVQNLTKSYKEVRANKPSGIMLSAPGALVIRETPSKKVPVSLINPGYAAAELSETVITHSDATSLTEIEEGVFSIQINSKGKNILTKELAFSLIQVLETIQKEPLVKVLIIKGTQPTFVQGDRIACNEAIEQKLYQELIAFPYPVIAEIQGDVKGVGFIVAAMCDFIVGSNESVFSFTNTKEQLFPTANEQKFFEERFGSVQAFEFLYNTTEQTGKQLQEKGWTFLVVQKDQVELYAKKLAISLAGKPSNSLRLLKTHFSRHLRGFVDQLETIALVSEKAQPKLSKIITSKITSPESNISLDVKDETTLIIKIGISEGPEDFKTILSALKNIVGQVNKSACKTIVLDSGYAGFLPASIDEARVNDVLEFQRLLFETRVPIITVLRNDTTGLSWLLSLFSEVCIYNTSATYSAPNNWKGAKLAKLAGLIFTQRFGNYFGKELLLAGYGYKGFELQERLGVLPAYESEQQLKSAIELAKSWSELPLQKLIDWKSQLVYDIKEKINNLPAWKNNTDELRITAIDKPVEVTLKSDVIKATAYPEGILLVKLEDREAKNMFSDAFVQGIVEVFEHINSTPAYKAVILTGYDKYFASGGTKETLKSIQEGKVKFTDLKLYHLAMECKVPVISAMQGHSVGAGWSLGMFADFIFFSEESKYVSPYMNYGFTPGAGATFIFFEKMGYDLARETMLTALEFSGQELKERGLLIPVVTRDNILEAAIKLARQIANGEYGNILALKHQLTHSLQKPLEDTYKLELEMHEKTFVGQKDIVQQIEDKFYQDRSKAVAVQKQSEEKVGFQPESISGESYTLPSIISTLCELLSNELRIEEHEISEDIQFVDLGLDSITGVTWVRKINEKYQISLEATQVYSYPTLKQLSIHVKEEVDKLPPSSKVPEVKSETILPQAEVKEVNTVSPNAILDIQESIKRLLANELRIDEHEISENIQFVDLGLDSITGVTWIRKINEKYGTSIEATQVYSYPTLTQLSQYVKDEAAKQGTLSEITELKKQVAETSTVITQSVISKKTQLNATIKLTSERHKWASKLGTKASGSYQSGAIAVIGMAGQFPQAKSIDEFWQNISQGKVSITEIPSERWDWKKYYKEGGAVPGKINSKWMGALENYDLFDPLFFNISPKEAINMDPQQRMFLQVCWQTIEDAGYNPQALSGSKCGVFVGCGPGDYHQLSKEHQISAQGFTGSSSSILAGRVSYFLNLHGPCLSIETACSSSLVAIANACDSLNTGSSNLALAGGVSIMSGPEMHIRCSQAGMLSADGRCFTFDQRANGFVPGEGVGAVLLKRLSDAERDRDIIYGVIQGWGINQDGQTNGITAPNPEAQTRLEQDVYDKFGINPEHIQLVEAHGTGTKLGDPIEVRALKDAFKKYTDKKDYCVLSSVKSNIGHCLTAAGVASFIKTMQALKHKKLPPTVNFDQLNEHINLKESPFYVNEKLVDWQVNGVSRQAAISAFGFSGTNAHLVVSEYNAPVNTQKPFTIISQNDKVIIPLSAKTETQLKQKVVELLNFIENSDSSTDLIRLSYTLQTARAAMEERLGVLVSSTEQLAEKLQVWLRDEKSMGDFYVGHIKQNRDEISVISTDDVVKETIINKYLTQKNISGILNLWVKGLDFEWGRLYGEEKPQRINLPVYPFAKEHYWFKASDINQTIRSEIAEVIHPLLHKNTSDLYQHSYTSYLSGDDYFVTDFQVSKRAGAVQKVLPAMVCAEMVRAAMQQAIPNIGKSARLKLQNIIWGQAIVVSDKKEVSIAINTNNADQIWFEIYSSEEGQEIIHCQGQVIFENTPLTTIDLVKLNGQMQSTIDPEQIYNAYARVGASYGPSYQCIASVMKGGQQTLVQLNVPETFDYKSSGFVMHPGILEGILQACNYFAADGNILTGSTLGVLSIDSLTILKECTREMFVWVRYSSDESSAHSLPKIDVEVMDEKGNVCIKVRGLTLNQANEQISATQLDWKENTFTQIAEKSQKITLGSKQDFAGNNTGNASREKPMVSLTSFTTEINPEANNNSDSITEEEIQIKLRVSLAEALFMKSSEIDTDKPFIELGLDSIIGVEWVDAINKLLKINVTATKVYEHPTINNLSSYIKEKFFAQATIVPEAPAQIQLTTVLESGSDFKTEESKVGISYVQEETVRENISLEGIQQQLCNSLAEALYMKPSDIDLEKPFIELGLDSIVGVEWVNALNKLLNINITATKVYEHPTIYNLAGYLKDKYFNDAIKKVVKSKPVSLGIPHEKTIKEISAVILSEISEREVANQVQEEVVENEVQESVSLEEIQQQLRNSLAESLYMKPSAIDMDKPFIELGLDSIVGVEWVNALNKLLNINLTATKVYEYSSIYQLAQFIKGKCFVNQLIAFKSEPKKAEVGKIPQAVNLRVAPSTQIVSIRHPHKQNNGIARQNSSLLTINGSPEERKKQWIQIGEHYGFVLTQPTTILDKIGFKAWMPPALSANEMRIQVKASAINFPDTMCVSGLYPTMPNYPFVPGFEVSGVVTEVGDKVSAFKPGDQVIALTGKEMGGHASFVNVSEADAIQKPANVSFEEACSLPVVFATVHYAFEQARLTNNESVLIHTATGGVGLMALQLAAIRGAIPFTTTSKQHKADVLSKLGIANIFNYQADFDKEIRKITNNRGVDVVLNMLSGNGIQKGLNSLASSGRYMEIAVHALKTSGKLDMSSLVENQTFHSIDLRRLISRENSGFSMAQMLQPMKHMLESKQIVPIVSRIYPIHQIADALHYVNKGQHIGKVVISHTADAMIDNTEGCIQSIAAQRSHAMANPIKMAVSKPGIALQTMRNKNEAVAIIGMAGQFPKSNTLEDYWQNIIQGVNCVSEVPKNRWDVNAIFDEKIGVPGKTNSKWMGMLDEYDMFDPLFFNISPLEAEKMDPQQRLFLQSCWHAIEHAGYNPKSLSGSKCGVFAGCGAGDYYKIAPEQQLSAHGLMGSVISILAARISYLLNLQGPCLSIDTACSSSLVAIAEACNSLSAGNSDMAIAGGVTVYSTPAMQIMTSQSGMLSPDGRCHSFDQKANGFVPGEGVGVVLLKRLSDAERDNDKIYGVIQGWGVNQDGKTNGITAPNPESQTRLQQEVYDRHNINPAEIQLVEAHGTGTKLGDPIEVEGLIQSFTKYTDKQGYCALSSVKSNIGHGLAAAGVSGVIKLALALKNKQLPPVAGFNELNEHINLKNSPFFVNSKAQEWKVADGEKRQAAISSFGFSGTNAHLVISEYDAVQPTEQNIPQNIKSSKNIVLLSARTPEQLNQKANDLLKFIQTENQEINLGEMAYTLQTGREAMGERLGFMVNTEEELVNKLELYIAGNENITDAYIGQVNRTRDTLSLFSKDADMQRVFEQWVSQGKLSKIVELWVNGLAFDWNRIYGEIKPRRMGLPVYPFGKERYWLQADERISIGNGMSASMLHPLVQMNTSDITQQCFSSVFNGEEFFLNDHNVQGQKVLPGVAYLEMARAAIEYGVPEQSRPGIIELCNMVWMAPMVVEEQKHASIALYENSESVGQSNGIEYEVYSNGTEEEKVHFKGQVKFIKTASSNTIDITGLKKQMNSEVISGEMLYSELTKMQVNYGPAFKVITSIFKGNGQVIAHLRLPSIISNGKSDNYLLHPSIMDAALQSSIVLITKIEHISGNPYVPFALASLRMVSSCSNEMYAWVRYSLDSKQEDSLVKLDIDICNSNGHVCVELRGFSYRILDGMKTSSKRADLNIRVKGNGNGSAFDLYYYQQLMDDVLNNHISVNEAVDLS